jgi:paired small multidrug resistance pump
MQLYNIVGILGVTGVLLAYFLLQVKKIEASGFFYSFLNALGAIGILYSLYYDWNLSSAIIQCVWILISFYGIYKAFTDKNRKEKLDVAKS